MNRPRSSLVSVVRGTALATGVVELNCSVKRRRLAPCRLIILHRFSIRAIGEAAEK
jgi:hypothetical protein